MVDSGAGHGAARYAVQEVLSMTSRLLAALLVSIALGSALPLWLSGCPGGGTDTGTAGPGSASGTGEEPSQPPSEAQGTVGEPSGPEAGADVPVGGIEEAARGEILPDVAPTPVSEEEPSADLIADAVPPSADRGLGETIGMDENADFGGRLNDPRFPDTLDNSPESWPIWTPTHRIDSIEVPLIDGTTLAFQRSGGKKLVYGEAYQDGDKFEIRYKLFENGKRIQFDRTQCTWKESGGELELGCKSPSGEISRTFYEIERTEGTWTLTLTERSRKDVRFAPRRIVAQAR